MSCRVVEAALPGDVAIQFDLQALDAMRGLPTVERVQPSMVLLPYIACEQIREAERRAYESVGLTAVFLPSPEESDERRRAVTAWSEAHARRAHGAVFAAAPLQALDLLNGWCQEWSWA